jgi:hypothetical protein
MDSAKKVEVNPKEIELSKEAAGNEAGNPYPTAVEADTKAKVDDHHKGPTGFGAIDCNPMNCCANLKGKDDR